MDVKLRELELRTRSPDLHKITKTATLLQIIYVRWASRKYVVFERSNAPWWSRPAISLCDVWENDRLAILCYWATLSTLWELITHSLPMHVLWVLSDGKAFHAVRLLKGGRLKLILRWATDCLSHAASDEGPLVFMYHGGLQWEKKSPPYYVNEREKILPKLL